MVLAVNGQNSTQYETHRKKGSAQEDLKLGHSHKGRNIG
jgi:hypothetical protein